MNYWIAEMTGLGDTTLRLFDYIEVGIMFEACVVLRANPEMVKENLGTPRSGNRCNSL